MSQQIDDMRVAVTPDSIRHVMGHFATGVTAITAMFEGEPVGFACQSFSSLSLDPPMVSFSVSLKSSSWPKVTEAASFCINVLSEEQADVSNALGRSGPDKFAAVSWRPSAYGAPLIDGVAAFIDARVWAEYDGGDHVIVAATILDLGADDSRTPLMYHRGSYGLYIPTEPGSVEQ